MCKCKDCAMYFRNPHDLCYLAEIEEEIVEDTTLDVGENTFVVAPNMQNTVTFTPTAAGTYTINVKTENGVVAAMVGRDYAMYGMPWTIVVTEADVDFTVSLTVATTDWAGGNIVVEVTFEAAESEEPAAPTVNELVMGNTQINQEDAIYSYTATENGTLTLTAGGAIMGMVSISYTVNGGDSVVIELQSTANIDLVAGDVVVVTIEAEGYSSLTASFALPSEEEEEEEDETEEGGAVASATYVAAHAGGRKLMVVVNADGTIEITRSDLTGNFGTGGCTTVTGTWEVVDGAFVATVTSSVSGMSFAANGTPLSITWGTAVFTDFAPQA